jgi:ergothioneine biosynthesis protein EgtB
MHPFQYAPTAAQGDIGLHAVSPLQQRFEAVRAQTEALAAPLSDADCQVQSMPDASPTKWHLAHTTWFFETFVLEPFEEHFKPVDPAYRVLFNSYYQWVGEQHPRAQRGLVTRPDMAAIRAYRGQVNQRVLALLQAPLAGAAGQLVASRVELGLQHEQQHQELILTDLLHLLSCNPTAPVYQPRWPLAPVAPLPQGWVDHADGLVQIGCEAPQPLGQIDHPQDSAEPAFAFDNETPRHTQFLRPYALAKRLTTHGEWAEFVADGGYQDPRWWLSAGWDWVRTQGIQAPLYWRRSSATAAAGWHCFTLHGLVPLDAHTPITHISYFEADAFARWWSGQHPQQPAARLPTEVEWEHAAEQLSPALLATGNFLESGALHPMPVAAVHDGPLQMWGDVWEWTASSYLPYPGFVAWDGAVGEYNAKFMVNQMVLRGGSCATPCTHMRNSYRNFFPAEARWQFNGLRLARDAD